MIFQCFVLVLYEKQEKKHLHFFYVVFIKLDKQTPITSTANFVFLAYNKFFRAYFWKKIVLLNSLTLSVCPSVCTLFFRHLSTYDLQIWILREDYLSTRSTAGFSDPKPRSSGIELRLEWNPLKLTFFPYISSISEKQSMFFNWHHKVIVKYKNFRKKILGSNLWFNYSHLEKQDKESLTDVVT
jgi:hypothetical protein